MPAHARLALAPFVAVLPALALAAVAPAVRGPALVSVSLAYGVAVAAILLATSLPDLSALRRPPTALVAATCAVAASALGFALARGAHGRIPWDIVSGVASTVGVLAFGTVVGASVGTRIQHTGHLLAVALASSAADIWSVHAPEGITRAVVRARDAAIPRLVTVSVAVPPSRAPDAVIGLGDVIFVALYLAAAQRHALSRTRMLVALGMGLLAAGGAAIALSRPLPALPAVGLAVVLFTPRARQVEPGDRLPTLVAGALVVGAILRVALLHRR